MTVALLVITCFLTNNLQAIAVYENVDKMMTEAFGYQVDVNTFSLSPELGTIRYLHKGTSDKVVFHIQDAHCNYGAQNSIYEIIGILNRDYNVRKINLEGGAGDYDLSVFTDIPDIDIRKEVAEHFVKWGDVSGPELFALMNPEKVDLWGVENIELYIKNLKVYRDSLSYGEKAKKLINELRYHLNKLKISIFNEALVKMDAKYAAYKTNNIEFREYLNYLVHLAKKNGIELKQYPNIFLLSHVMEEEKLIDFKRANIQREFLIKDLEQRISRKDMNEFSVMLLQLKDKKINEYDFYEYLLETAKKYGKDIKEYPKLHQYIIYMSIYAKVDKSLVMEEIDKIEKVLKNEYYENEKQKELDILSRDLVLLQTLFDFSFTVRDYEHYVDNKANFNVNNYLSFIRVNSFAYDLSPDFEQAVRDLDIYRQEISGFYEYSFKRDVAFLENMELSGNNTKSGIIVTGGFHTENLLELLKEKDISYISIMPNFINEKSYKSPYFEILADKQVSQFDKRMETILYSIQVPSIMNVLNRLANNDPRREEIFRIKALALGSLLSDRKNKKPKVIVTNNNKYIVFDLRNGEPVVNEYNERAFNGSFQDQTAYDIVASEVDLTPTSTVWALSRVAEENIRSLEKANKIDLDELRRRAKELLRQLPKLEQTLPEKVFDIIEVKSGLTDAAGETIAVSSNSGIYLPGNSLEDALRKLIHEFVGGTFSGNKEYINGHTLAAAVEQSVSAGDINTANNILSSAKKYANGKTLWDMTDIEAGETEGMDFAMAFSLWGTGNPAKHIANYLNKPEISETLYRAYSGNKPQLQEVNKLIRELADRMKAILGEEPTKKIFAGIMTKSSEFDLPIKWLNSLESFLANIEPYLSSDPVSYYEVLNTVAEVSENSASFEGFGEILNALLEEKYSVDQIIGLFTENIHSGVLEYIRKPWERLSIIAEQNPKKYMRLRPFRDLYTRTYNLELLNEIARSDRIREEFGDKIRNMDFLVTLINAYNQNRTSILRRVTKAEQSDERLSERKKKQEQISEFVIAFLRNNGGTDLVGAVVGGDSIADPFVTRTSKQINILNSLNFKSLQERLVTKPVKEITENDINEYAVNQSILFGIDIVDRTQRRAYPLEINGKKVAVKFIREHEARDIFDEKYTVAEQHNANPDEVLSPDSYLLRGYDGAYTIVLVDREDRSRLNEALKAAAGKLLRVSRTIEAMKDLSSETMVSDLIGIDPFKDTPLDEKLEGVKNFTQLSVRYLNRDKYLNDSKRAGSDLTDRDKQLFNYLMAYAIMSETLQRDNSLAGHDEGEASEINSLSDAFKGLINRNPELFSRQDGIPLPDNWDYFKGQYDKTFQRGMSFIQPGSYVRGGRSSAIGNIMLDTGETVKSFEDELYMNVDMNVGKILITAKQGKLLNGDISLNADTAPLATERKDDLMVSLRTLLNDTLTKNTLTSYEYQQVESLIEDLGRSEIYTFSGNREQNLFGFTYDGNLFLDEGILLDPISLLHEMGEYRLDIPEGYQGLNNHTFLRGAGGKTREALASIIADADQAEDKLKQREARALLSEMKISSANFIDQISKRRKLLHDEDIPEPEKKLIEYNFDTMKTRIDEGKLQMIESLGIEVYLYGLQDHMDPVMNARFTDWIKVLTNSLNRGVHDIIIIRESDVFASAKLAQLKRQAKDGMMKAGHNLTLIVQRPGEHLEFVLQRAFKQADAISAEDSKKLPKIFLDLAYGRAESGKLDRVSAQIRAFVSGQGREDQTVIVSELIDNLPAEEAPKIDIAKLMVVAGGLLDDKRRVIDFNMSPEDLFESRKDMIRAFEKGQIIDLEGYDPRTAEGLDAIIGAITSGLLLMRITRVNWEEITDWFEANTEIMRSL